MSLFCSLENHRYRTLLFLAIASVLLSGTALAVVAGEPGGATCKKLILAGEPISLAGPQPPEGAAYDFTYEWNAEWGEGASAGRAAPGSSASYQFNAPDVNETTEVTVNLMVTTTLGGCVNTNSQIIKVYAKPAAKIDGPAAVDLGTTRSSSYADKGETSGQGVTKKWTLKDPDLEQPRDLGAGESVNIDWAEYGPGTYTLCVEVARDYSAEDAELCAPATSSATDCITVQVTGNIPLQSGLEVVGPDAACDYGESLSEYKAAITEDTSKFKYNYFWTVFKGDEAVYSETTARPSIGINWAGNGAGTYNLTVLAVECSKKSTCVMPDKPSSIPGCCKVYTGSKEDVMVVPRPEASISMAA